MTEFIEKVLDKYDIHLIRKKALCPLHDDHNPSMSVDLGNGRWYCFVCGVGGGPLQLIMKIEGVSYSEAKEIAANLGIRDIEKQRKNSRGVLKRSSQQRAGRVSREERSLRGKKYVPPRRRTDKGDHTVTQENDNSLP